MTTHIALFKFKEGTSKEEITSVLQEVKDLETKCEGVRQILAGENYHNESKGMTHGVVVIAEDQHGLDNYRNHPLHEKIAQKIEAIEDDGLGFDFEDLR